MVNELIASLDYAIEELEKCKKDKQRIRELEEQLAKAQQKVKLVNRLIKEDLKYDIGWLADNINSIDDETTIDDIYKWLIDNGYLTDTYMPTAKSINNKLMELDVQIHQEAKRLDIEKRTLITADGVIFFTNEYLGDDNQI